MIIPAVHRITKKITIHIGHPFSTAVLILVLIRTGLAFTVVSFALCPAATFITCFPGVTFSVFHSRTFVIVLLISTETNRIYKGGSVIEADIDIDRIGRSIIEDAGRKVHGFSYRDIGSVDMHIRYLEIGNSQHRHNRS